MPVPPSSRPAWAISWGIIPGLGNASWLRNCHLWNGGTPSPALMTASASSSFGREHGEWASSTEQRLVAADGDSLRDRIRGYVEGLTPAIVRERLSTAKERARGEGVDYRAVRVEADLETKPNEILKQYLRVYRPFFEPHNFSQIHLPILLDVSPASFSGWIQRNRSIPLETFIELVNFLEIEDPSWLLYSFYKDSLDRYFDPQVSDGSVVLVTKEGGEKRAFPWEIIRTHGLAALMYEGRVKEGLNLEQLADRINRLPSRMARKLRVNPNILGEYEAQKAIPNKGRNEIYLDFLIEALALNPSEAFIAAGRPWLPGLMRVVDHSTSQPIAPMMRFPYDVPAVEYKPVERPHGTNRREAVGFGGLIRRARLTMGWEIQEATVRCEISDGGLKQFELHDVRVPFETLRLMAREYAPAIQKLIPYFKDPLHSLIIAHNSHYYPETTPEEFMTEEGPLFFESEADARAAKGLVPLPRTDFRRRCFLLRMRNHWSREEASDRMGVYPAGIRKIENPDEEFWPNLELVRRLAELEGGSEASFTSWRRSVQETFYPIIPWEFLNAEGIFIANPYDRDHLLQVHLGRGEIRDDHLGWTLFRHRTGLDRNEFRQETADRMGVSKGTLLDAERSARRPSDEFLAAWAKGHGASLEGLKGIRDSMWDAAKGEPTRPQFPHIRRVVIKAAPNTKKLRVLQAGAEYRIYETQFRRTEHLEDLIGGTVQLALDALRISSHVILRGLPFAMAGFKKLHQAAQKKLPCEGESDLQLFLVTADGHIRVSRQGGVIETEMVDEEDASDGPLFRLEEVRRFLTDTGQPEREVEPYPMDDHPISNARLLVAIAEPDLTHYFPESVGLGLLKLGRWSEIERTFLLDLNGYDFPKTRGGIDSAARFFGVPAPLLWLRMHPRVIPHFKARNDHGDELPLVTRKTDHWLRRLEQIEDFLPYRNPNET